MTDAARRATRHTARFVLIVAALNLFVTLYTGDLAGLRARWPVTLALLAAVGALVWTYEWWRSGGRW